MLREDIERDKERGYRKRCKGRIKNVARGYSKVERWYRKIS
jgi:hypothetical protein